MTLAEKGKIVPAPILSKFPELVSREIQRWKFIISATHWDLYDSSRPDGADFYVGAEELGHIHLDGAVHLLVGKPLKESLLNSNRALKFPYGGEWVLFNIHGPNDVQHAIELFKTNYERIRGGSLKI